MNRLARALAIGALVASGAPGCSRSKADMFDGAQTDTATLRKFVTLRPMPVEAKWSVATVGADDMFGPADTDLWAVLRYADADLAAVSRALDADEPVSPSTTDALPAWLSDDAALARFKRGSAHVFDGRVTAGKPFASALYTTGFALMLADRRVLIHFASR